MKGLLLFLPVSQAQVNSSEDIQCTPPLWPLMANENSNKQHVVYSVSAAKSNAEFIETLFLGGEVTQNGSETQSLLLRATIGREEELVFEWQKVLKVVRDSVVDIPPGATLDYPHLFRKILFSEETAAYKSDLSGVASEGTVWAAMDYEFFAVV